MSKRAEKAAMMAYPNVEQPVWDESYPKTLFVRHTERNAFIKGYEQAEKDLGWHLVEESLPKVGEEVIVLIDELDFHLFYRLAFRHIVNEGETVDIYGKPYKPESHKGWNSTGVKFWMPMPKIPNKK